MSNEAAYFKNGNLLFKIETGKVTGIDTERFHIKNLKTTPSYPCNKITVIDKKEFEEAFQKIIKGI